MLLLLIYLMIFGSVTLLVYTSFRVLKDIQYVPVEDDGWGEEGGALKKNPFFRLMMLAAGLLARLNVNMNLGAYESVLKRKLDAAGRPWDMKPTEYMGLKQMSAVAFGILGFALHLAVPGARVSLLLVIALATLGYILPNFVLNKLIAKRHLSIIQDLPFCCDLLTLSVEAGLDFGSALEKVVTNGPPGPLRNELHMVVQETKIGKTRREALLALAERTQMQEVSSFVGSITQAERMGTGFAPILRIQSTQMRNSRFERAEKMAQKVPVKILFPIIIANLLSIAIILIVPLLSAIMDTGI